MGGAFEGGLPERALQTLRSGDVLFVQTFGSSLSWVIMYLTSSEVSHVALYLGGGTIVHSTLRGVLIEPIQALFDPDTRILPCIWSMPDEKRAEVARIARKEYDGLAYAWLTAALKGVRILTGRDWPYFRWIFFADVSMSLLLLDVPFMVLLGYPVVSWLIPAYAVLIALNWALWKVRPLVFSEWTGKPSDLLYMLQSEGNTFLFDAYAVQEQLTKRTLAQ